MLLRDLIFTVFLLVLAIAVSAGEATPAAEDPALEARVTQVAQVLRCLVCQNQTIADSHAGLAQDLKNEIRDRLREGASDGEVIDFMVGRYGDFVLYRPPFKATTWLLWLGPFLLLAAAAAVFLRKLRRYHGNTKELSAEDLSRAEALLADSAPRNPLP